MTSPLAGRLIATTRDETGSLETALEAVGARIVHVPLITVVADDAVVAAAVGAWTADDLPDWVVVTSRHGARILGRHLAGRESLPAVAAVGRATAADFERVTGRHVDLVPEEQLATALAAALVDRIGRPGARILVAQADRAEPTLAEALVAAGHVVEIVIAYRTELRPPDDHALVRLAAADAVVVMSGSAAEALAAADTEAAGLPPICAIGPTTAAAARRAGLEVAAVAEHHSVDGVVEALERHLRTMGA